MISIIIPTYNESKNILNLITAIKTRMTASGIGDFEILVMDDDSPDRTAILVNELNDPKVRAVNRRGRTKALAAAVIDGFKESKGEVLLVMDADLSHPVEVLPRLIKTVQDGAQLAVGSRYIQGGSIVNWPIKRVITSKAACVLARPFTKVKDATSGFFCLRKPILEGINLNPSGFKIGLEVIVKAKHRGSIVEVPYIFTDRKEGESKLGLYVIFCYLKQIISFIGKT